MALGKKTGGGSRKGKPNKATAALKEMILGALDDVGGQSYLAAQAKENPTAFLSLIGRVLPTTLSAGGGKGSCYFAWSDNPQEALPDPSRASSSRTTHATNGAASTPAEHAGG